MLLIQIFMPSPSGYCGAHMRICHSGTKYADTSNIAESAVAMRDRVLSFFMIDVLRTVLTTTTYSLVGEDHSNCKLFHDLSCLRPLRRTLALLFRLKISTVFWSRR